MSRSFIDFGVGIIKGILKRDAYGICRRSPVKYVHNHVQEFRSMLTDRVNLHMFDLLLKRSVVQISRI